MSLLYNIHVPPRKQKGAFVLNCVIKRNMIQAFENTIFIIPFPAELSYLNLYPPEVVSHICLIWDQTLCSNTHLDPG